METFMDSFLCDFRCNRKDNGTEKDKCREKFCKQEKGTEEASIGIAERKALK